MALSFEIPAEIRDDLGKGASRRLRREANKVPAVLYGADQPAVNLSVNHDYLIKALDHEAFYTHILTVSVEGQKEKQQVILKALQRHPYKPRILHMDLLRIDIHEKLTLRVPLHFSGEAESPAVKIEGGVISHLMSDIEIRCLPADLPEYITVDLSHLALHQHVHLSELKFPQGVESVLLSHNDDQSVASAHMPRTMEEPTPEGEIAPGAVPTVEGTEGEADKKA
ncbi:MAG: 50S ribosomal protein L25/general stress protein Ctc [Gammaproteobacteria bacterium]